MFHFKAPYAEKTPQPQTASLIISCSESRDLTTDLAAAPRLLFKPKETKHNLVHHVLNRTPIHCCKGVAQQFAGGGEKSWRQLDEEIKTTLMFVKYEAAARRRLASLRVITGKGGSSSSGSVHRPAPLMLNYFSGVVERRYNTSAITGSGSVSYDSVTPICKLLKKNLTKKMWFWEKLDRFTLI